MAWLPAVRFGNLQGDIYGGVTAAVVALPLALAFGVASGAGPLAGIYGAIFVGFFAALFGGTPAQVSGPTGPMTVVMAVVVTQFADRPELAFAVVMFGGLFQILFGALRLGDYVAYMPYSVVSGFMSGIGAIIIIIQFLPFFGHPASQEGVLAALEAVPAAISAPNFDALAAAGLALSVMIFWPQRIRPYVPPTLAALVLSTLGTLFVFTAAPVIGDIPEGLPPIHVPTVDLARIGAMVQAAFILGVLGSIDSLLTSLVADTITRTRHDSNRELIGQGIGNIAAGLFGGLPGAGATMRTVVNVRAGGRTRLSGMLHALILLALVAGLAPLAEHIPHAALAGILLKVGFDIIDWGYLRRVHRVPAAKAAVMVITLLLTVFVDLITAVAVGLIMASLISAKQLAGEQMKALRIFRGEDGEPTFLTDQERALLRETNGRVLVTHFGGAFSFGTARDLAHRLNVIGGERPAMVFDFTDAGTLDASIAMGLDDLFAQSAANGQAVYVTGLDRPAAQLLDRMGVLDRIPKARRFEKRIDAIRAAVRDAQNPTPV